MEPEQDWNVLCVGWQVNVEGYLELPDCLVDYALLGWGGHGCYGLTWLIYGPQLLGFTLGLWNAYIYLFDIAHVR